jgi:hypothetical protein
MNKADNKHGGQLGNMRGFTQASMPRWLILKYTDKPFLQMKLSLQSFGILNTYYCTEKLQQNIIMSSIS